VGVLALVGITTRVGVGVIRRVGVGVLILVGVGVAFLVGVGVANGAGPLQIGPCLVTVPFVLIDSTQ